MSTKSKKFVLLVIILITIASMIAACGAPANGSPCSHRSYHDRLRNRSPATEMPATEAPATEAPATEAPAAEGAPFTIGISNPFISSEYRTQMIDELIAVNQEYMDAGSYHRTRDRERGYRCGRPDPAAAEPDRPGCGCDPCEPG